MTRAGRLIRNLLERFLGRYYEGPSAPRRLGEEVRLFRVFYPMATAEEWEAFAARLACNAYRDGFVRGYEWCERDWKGPSIEPEVLAELQSHDWSLAEQDPRLEDVLALGVDPLDPHGVIDETDRARYLDEVGKRLGTFRVTVDPVGIDAQGRRTVRR